MEQINLRYCWALDPGHGPLQAGKRSPMLPDGRRFFEWEFNREVAILTWKGLVKKGIGSIMLVDNQMERLGSSLMLRVDRFNKLPYSPNRKVLVSIHSNAFGSTWSSPNGVEVLYWHANEKAKAMAQVFQKNIVDFTGMRDRGVKPVDNLYLHMHCKGTVLLTETGFYTNHNEVKLLLDKSFRAKVAQAHVDAIIQIENLTI